VPPPRASTLDEPMRAPTPAQSLREYGRGLAGGLIFSLPLLYTMEMWWAGFIARPERILGYLACIFVLLLGYNHYVGIRQDASRIEVAIDSIEELGLGIITAAAMLYLLGRIGAGQSLEESLGQILIEAGVVAIGFSVGTAQLGADDGDDSGTTDDDEKDDDRSSLAPDVMIATCGAVLFGANVAPTEEIVMIAIEAGPARLIGIAVLSMAIAMLILYFSDFVRAKRLVRTRAPLQIAGGTIITYAVALVTSAVILWFFGRFDGVSLDVAVRLTVVLAFPAVLGASAGRLLLQKP
jgi:putative integral membrane protein (TIGR02587 family)